jgi:hypothetical protein
MSTRPKREVPETPPQKRRRLIQAWGEFLDTDRAKQITEDQIREMNAAFDEFCEGR